jgi:hypothetical protein
MTTKSLAILLAVLGLVFIVELVRRERLTFKYASTWMMIFLAAAFFAVFDNLLQAIATFFGFELTSNFVFFAILSGFVFLSLLLTIFLCQQNDRNDKMAQKIGLLEHDIEKIKKGLGNRG